jgi:hypothetical protein
VRDLDTLAARILPGTEGANNIFWSPDSRFIAFFVGRQLKKTDLAVGVTTTICDTTVDEHFGGSWGRRDSILFSDSGIFRVSATGGSATRVTNVLAASATPGAAEDQRRKDTEYGLPKCGNVFSNHTCRFQRHHQEFRKRNSVPFLRWSSAAPAVGPPRPTAPAIGFR